MTLEQRIGLVLPEVICQSTRVAEKNAFAAVGVVETGPPRAHASGLRLEPAAQYEDGHGGHRTDLVMRGSLGMGA